MKGEKENEKKSLKGSHKKPQQCLYLKNLKFQHIKKIQLHEKVHCLADVLWIHEMLTVSETKKLKNHADVASFMLFVIFILN